MSDASWHRALAWSNKAGNAVVRRPRSPWLPLLLAGCVLLSLRVFWIGSIQRRSLERHLTPDGSSISIHTGNQAVEKVSLLTTYGRDVSIVAPTLKGADRWWLKAYCSNHGCQSSIYSMDDDTEEGYLEPLARVGREASVYLSYIIQRYDDMPAYNIFIHGNRQEWHNDLIGSSTLTMLHHLQHKKLQQDGYLNLRCMPDPGCPDSLHPFPLELQDRLNNRLFVNFADIYAQILDVSLADVPLSIGVACCAQFAVTRERIRQRPKKDYERMLEWAKTQTWGDDYAVGFTFEKLWHIIFGMPAVHCPTYQECLCGTYGVCQ